MIAVQIYCKYLIYATFIKENIAYIDNWQYLCTFVVNLENYAQKRKAGTNGHPP